MAGTALVLVSSSLWLGCVSTSVTNPEHIKRGLSRYFLKDRVARAAASGEAAVENPALPRDSAAYDPAVKNLEASIAAEEDPTFKSLLEARRERLEAYRALEAVIHPPAGSTVAADAAERAKEAVALKEEKLALRLEDFNRLHERLTAESERELADRRNAEGGFLTKTQASLIVIPNLNMFQPAVVQSFSLRNLFQAFNPNSDPSDVRDRVEADLASSPVWDLEVAGAQKKKFDVSKLSEQQLELAVDSIAQERLSERWWHTRADLFSLDVGLAHPDLSVGEESRTFRRRVDRRLPEFLFGGGIHWGAIELSAGVVLYRLGNRDDDPDLEGDQSTPGKFTTDFYIAFSLELFRKNLRLGGGDS